MSKLKFFLILFTISLLIKISFANAQEKPGTDPEFVIGAYMQSTPWEKSPAPYYSLPDSALFSLWRAKDLGINTAMVNIRQPDYDHNIFYEGDQRHILPSNMTNLQDFPNVIAMNTSSAYRLLDGTQPNPPNTAIRNFDFIYFYSGAYYSKWDATRSSIPRDELGLKHNFGSKITFNGKDYWSSGTGHPEDLLVKGPNYNQETRYRSSTYPNPWANEVQTYEVNFNMLLKTQPKPSELNYPLCEIIVWVKYSIGNKEYQKALTSRVLKVGEIILPAKRLLTYNFGDFYQIGLSPSGSKQLIDVEFRVKYLNPNQELLIDFIEVYDINIWRDRLGNREKQIQARTNIANYLSKFRNANPQFYANNLKYFFSVDEPHTVDSYIPLAFVESVLDSLNKVWPEGAPLLFTHLYPEWNGYRNGAKVIPLFVKTIKPKPFHFYYEPFWYSASTAEGLDLFSDILTQANEAIGNGDFWVTIEVWDDPKDFLDWRMPTPNELNASVMLALAHGAKGIFFEPFYSYGSVKGLMEPTEPYEPRDIGIQVRDFISPRLKGILGKTLLRLNYSDNYINIEYQQGSSPKGTPNFFDFLRIQTYGMPYHWHAGFLNQADHPDNKYFLLVNLGTTYMNTAVLDITNNSGFKNLSVRDIENHTNSLDETIYLKTTHRFNLPVPAGEGYLFQVAPVVKYGGKLAYDESIENALTLLDDMTIENGVTLTVNADYTCYGNIYLKGNARIQIPTNSGGKITFAAGKSIIQPEH